MHMEPAAHAEDENLLGSVEDLMVKGYDGNLSFERDFVGEAMDMINRDISDCLMARLDVVTIIHGKGTGALRAAVQDHLRHEKHVRSIRGGRYGEGDSGVTIVEFK